MEYKPAEWNQNDIPKLPTDSKELIRFLEKWEKQVRPILDFRASEERKKRVVESMFYIEPLFSHSPYIIYLDLATV